MNERESGNVSLALSGGGHRAALFALGVLLYLGDAQKNRSVTSIASVSGGSITNGYFAKQSLPYHRLEPNGVRAVTAELASTLTHKGSLMGQPFRGPLKVAVPFSLVASLVVMMLPFRLVLRMEIGAVLVAITAVLTSFMFVTWLSRAYIFVLVVSLWASLALPWIIHTKAFARFVIFLCAIAIWVWALAGRRSWICAAAFQEVLFSKGRRAIRLSEIQGELDHVLCSTELQSSEQLYFSKNFVYGYRFGKGAPGDFSLARAVQASACLPGAFAPRWFQTSDFAFAYQTPDHPPQEDRAPKRHYLILTDGGVYDNMSNQWAEGFGGRCDAWPSLATEHHRPSQLIVVNASAGRGWKDFKRSQVPGLGEILALLRIKDVLYDQTTAPRRRALVARFNEAARSGIGMMGALVDISQSPFDVPDAFVGRTEWPDRVPRAQAAIAALGKTRTEWAVASRANASVGTVLWRIDADVSARLLHHAYVLAMINLHVVLGYPLLAVPSRGQMADLLQPKG